MKYQTTAGFDLGLAKLPREHRRLFTDAVRAHLLPALAAGAHRGEAPWPRRCLPGVYTLPNAYQLVESLRIDYGQLGPFGIHP